MPENVNNDAAEVVNNANETVANTAQSVADSLVSTTVEINELMKSVNTTIEDVAKSLSSSPLYSCFIQFSVGNINILSVSTSEVENMAVSLVNKKNGSGEANTFTLTIAYGPNFRGNFDPNALEMALMANEQLIAKSPERLRCRLRYGYGHNDLKTSVYEGLLLNYTLDCQDGILIYTLTGYSGLTRYVEQKDPLSIKEVCIIEPPKESSEDVSEETQPPNQNSDNSEPGNVSDQQDITPEGSDTSSENADNSSGGDSSEEDKAVTPTVTADRVKAQPTIVAQWIIHKYLVDDTKKEPLYNCKFGEVNGESVRASDVAVEMAMQLDKNPMKALTEVLDRAIHNSQSAILDGNTTIRSEAKITYKWFVSDEIENGKPSIYIVADNPAEHAKSAVNFTFNWGAPNIDSDGTYTSIVVSFKPSFEGSSLMALWDSYQQESEESADADNQTATATPPTKTNQEKQDEEQLDATSGETAGTDEVIGSGSFFIKDDGSIGIAEQATGPYAGGTLEAVTANIEQLRSTWVSHVQYPYKATLTTMGIPKEIPCTGIIGINALVGYNSNESMRKHHSSGRYMVLSTEDRIDSSGFTTTWDLVKIDTVTVDQYNAYIQNSGAYVKEEEVDDESAAEDPIWKQQGYSSFYEWQRDAGLFSNKFNNFSNNHSNKNPLLTNSPVLNSPYSLKLGGNNDE